MPPLGIATIYTSRRFYIFMRRTTPVEPSEPSEPIEPFEPVEPAPSLSNAIKGRQAQWANPEV